LKKGRTALGRTGRKKRKEGKKFPYHRMHGCTKKVSDRDREGHLFRETKTIE